MKPRYKKGDRVRAAYHGRFSSGPDVEFVITSVGPNHGGMGNHRYWGVCDRGCGHGAYENQIVGIA